MNEKGFGLAGLLAFAVFVAGAVILFNIFVTNLLGFTNPTSSPANYNNEYRSIRNINISNTNNTSSIEKKVLQATEKYLHDNYDSFINSGYIYISIDELVNKGYLDSTVCKGYTNVSNSDYQTYLNCGTGYTTSTHSKM